MMRSAPVAASAAAAPSAAPVVSAEAKEYAAVFERVLDGMSASDKIKATDKKRFAEIRKKLQNLYDRLAAHELSGGAVASLQAICVALNAGDADEALKKHSAIVASEWQGNSQWLPALKQILTLFQQLRK
jgi:hypothetical protein